VHAAVQRADGLTQSPQETRPRLLLHASPFDRPVAQYTVRDTGGRFIARVHVVWPERRAALEHDGM
jgi:hypothetical protein